MWYAAEFFYSYYRATKITEDFTKISKFLTDHSNVSKKLSHQGITGFKRNRIIGVFCSEFIGTLKPNPRTGFLCCKDEAIENQQYLEDILRFCLTTDVCDRLGMSIKDIMNLDLASYRSLRDMLKQIPRSETKELSDALSGLNIK